MDFDLSHENKGIEGMQYVDAGDKGEPSTVLVFSKLKYHLHALALEVGFWDEHIAGPAPDFAQTTRH